MNRRETLFAIAGALSAPLAIPSTSFAQTLDKSKIVRFLVGFPAGGSVDVVARLVAEQFRTDPGVNAIVENVSGAGGRIAIERAKVSTPDGTTILVTPAAMMTLYPLIFSKLSYDPVKDFIPVSPLCTLEFALVVTSAVPDSVKTLADLVEWYKANPSKAAYGHGGSGSPMHFIGALLGQHAKLDLTQVPYRGAPPLVQDALSGQVAVAITTVTDLLPHIKAGKLRPIAVSSKERSKFLPDVPTFVEQGATSIVSEDWFGMFVPAGTPTPIVEQLNAAVNKALKAPTVLERLNQLAYVPAGGSSADFAKRLKADIEKWAPVVKSTGFKIEE
ncbi:Bug family tripartite tricarboxylate transporter substrate binding protein [Pseudorhodoplanes sp.]|uniref:Bug family tripartite tricarboxylate transporter substrate binding protein n=1 Tax=Pseudorhodoplanes sp. TaxID=1934341 RepID=UPI002C651A39|nr:Bug family tripartite tricarboxylate transporter substrate binding protein [Pseudorhodoplanes sp.]HWV53294.1 Bug family tripartite tricarboxylate transporter substrate binding protein [Pseudorhodoplanes sp.]